MAQTEINQNQLSLGSETAVDLLAMQNGWKGQMITALDNKIPGYASSADTMPTLVNKFAALTGNTPDSVYGIFKAFSYGKVWLHNFSMPKTSNNTWEITVCKKVYHDGVINDMYANNNFSFNIDRMAGKAFLKVPVYREDDPASKEYITFESASGVYSFVYGTKYWFKIGYSADGKYYAKVSTDGTSYTTILEAASARKTEGDDYLYFYMEGSTPDGESDVLYITGCSVVIDGTTVFDGSGNITISNSQANADVTWQDGAVYLLQAIQS